MRPLLDITLLTRVATTRLVVLLSRNSRSGSAPERVGPFSTNVSRAWHWATDTSWRQIRSRFRNRYTATNSETAA
jgi:hypothetical protein